MEKRIIENEQEAFKVPEGYFEGFEERLMARIATEEKAEKPVPATSTRQLWINRSAIAVGIIGMVFIAAASIIRIQNEIETKANQIITAQSDSNDAYYDVINENLSNEDIEDALAQIYEEDDDDMF